MQIQSTFVGFTPECFLWGVLGLARGTGMSLNESNPIELPGCEWQRGEKKSYVLLLSLKMPFGSFPDSTLFPINLKSAYSISDFQ